MGRTRDATFKIAVERLEGRGLTTALTAHRVAVHAGPALDPTSHVDGPAPAGSPVLTNDRVSQGPTPGPGPVGIIAI